MGKEDVVHICDGILLSHKKNKFESVLVRWINQKPVIQSEVSQKETKHIYMESRRDLMCKEIASGKSCTTRGARKVVLMNLCAGKEWRRRCREWTCGHSGARSG